MRAFEITVTDVDDPPTAVDDSATVVEDAAATAIDVLANDTDVDGGPDDDRSVDAAGERHGGDHRRRHRADVSAERELLQRPPGTTPDTFTYTLNGGSTATVSVTVTCVDDPPAAVDDAATVAEDSAATAIDVLANDTDLDGGPKTIASVTQPANGTVVLTGGMRAHTGLTYEPDPDYCNEPAGTPGHVHLHAQRRLDGDGLGDGHLRRRRADGGRRHARRSPRTRPRARSTCWPTTPTPTAARWRSRR